MDRTCATINNRARAWLGRLVRDERGATAVEYGLIISLIVIAMVGALMNLADANSLMWNNVSAKVVGTK